MYFISRHYNLFSRAIKIQSPYRYAITFGALTVFISLWLFLFYFPRATYISRQAAAVRQCHEQRVLLSQAKHASKNLQHDIAHITQQLAQCRSDRPFSAQLMTLLGQARAHSVQLKNFFIAQEERSDWYVRRELALDVQAQLNDAHAFFAALAQSGILATCDDFSINQLEDAKISMRCTVELYELI